MKSKSALSNICQPDPDPYQQIVVAISHEFLRQARHTFNLNLVASCVSILISFMGVVLLFSGKTNEGTVTAATGLFSTTMCNHIAKQSNNQLEQLSNKLEKLRQNLIDRVDAQITEKRRHTSGLPQATTEDIEETD